uniref:Uncharacterized protein n=1 Tax=Rhizophora mucronata TaxID=61149 RepID=A0A2P2LIZ0_RHIMU
MYKNVCASTNFVISTCTQNGETVRAFFFRPDMLALNIFMQLVVLLVLQYQGVTQRQTEDPGLAGS